jgi:class 3 adenylate cyclase
MLGAYHQCVSETVTRFDGFVAKYMGDGVLIYFGYLRAHEDDAVRAVRAGRALIEEVRKLPVQKPLRVRIGVATGRRPRTISSARSRSRVSSRPSPGNYARQ